MRGSHRERQRWRVRYPLTRIASQSDLSPQAGRGKSRYAVARITLTTFSMISPIWSSVMISGGVRTSVSPATRTIRSLSWKALLSPAKPRLPGASATGHPLGLLMARDLREGPRRCG